MSYRFSRIILMLISLIALDHAAYASCATYQVSLSAPTQQPGTNRCCYTVRLTATDRQAFTVRLTPLLPSVTFASFTPIAPFTAPTNTASQIDIRNAAGGFVGLPNQNLGDVCISNVPTAGVQIVSQVLDNGGNVLCADTLLARTCTTAPQGCLDVTTPSLVCLPQQGAIQYLATTTITNETGQPVSVSFSATPATVTPSSITLADATPQTVHLVTSTNVAAGTTVPLVMTVGAGGAVVCRDTVVMTIPQCTPTSACASMPRTITTSSLVSTNGLFQWNGTFTTQVPVQSMSISAISAERKMTCPTVNSNVWLPLPVTTYATPANSQTPINTNAVILASVQGFAATSTTYGLQGALLSAQGAVTLTNAPFTVHAQLPPPIQGCPDSLRLCVRMAVTYVTGLQCDTTVCLVVPRRFLAVPWASGATTMPGPRTAKGDDVQNTERAAGSTRVEWNAEGTRATLVFDVPATTIEEGILTGTTNVRLGSLAGGGTITRATSGGASRNAQNGSVEIPVTFTRTTGDVFEARIELEQTFGNDDVECAVSIVMDYATRSGRNLSPRFMASAYRPSKQGGVATDNPSPAERMENVELYAITINNSNLAGRSADLIAIDPTPSTRILGGGSLDEDEGVMVTGYDEPDDMTNEFRMEFLMGKSVTTSKNNARLVQRPDVKTGDTPQREGAALVERTVRNRALPHGARTKPFYLTIQRRSSAPAEVAFTSYDANGAVLDRGTIVLTKPAAVVSSVNDGTQTPTSQMVVRDNGSSATVTLSLQNGGTVRLRCIDAQGRDVLPASTVNVVGDAASVATVPTATLAQGSYILVAEQDGAIIARTSFVIVR
jgi:hypothetical protein